MQIHTRYSDETPAGRCAVSWLDVVCAWLLALAVVLLTLLA